MIKNEKEYKITKAWLRKFEQSREEFDRLPESKEQPWLRQAQRGSVDGQIEQFKEQLEEYEALKSGKLKVTLPSTVAILQLPELLIRKRIAKGWTQQKLAQELGMHWQQVQRYEYSDYGTATLATICRVVDALTDEAAQTSNSKGQQWKHADPATDSTKLGQKKRASTPSEKPKRKTVGC